ncbi:MAG: CheR family methyltransferase [Acidimicrobiales bacterium]
METTTAKASAAASELSAQDFDFIKQLIKTKIAIQLDGKEYLIESRLSPVARLHKLDGVSELIVRLRAGTDRALTADVVEAMTTNETSFFRDGHPFEALKTEILPGFVERYGPSGRLNIWNAACSSGQESLSVAMLLNENFPQLAKPGSTRLLATDVSPAMVNRTSEGIYSRFEINRGLPANFAVKYFEQAGRNWKAKPSVLGLIHAQQLNLISQWSGLPKADVVMLRNVLIYFPAQVKTDILTRIRRTVLKPDGCLMLGSSESTAGYDDGFEAKHIGASTVFVPKSAG